MRFNVHQLRHVLVPKPGFFFSNPNAAKTKKKQTRLNLNKPGSIFFFDKSVVSLNKLVCICAGGREVVVGLLPGILLLSALNLMVPPQTSSTCHTCGKVF